MSDKNPTQSSNPQPRKLEADVVIIGAGLSGLLLAHRILSQDPDRSVVVLEAGPRCGGKIRTDTENGFLSEWGPECFHIPLNDPDFQWLYQSLPLKPITANHEAKTRYVVKNGQLVPLGPQILFSGKLLGLKARLRLALEPFSQGPKSQEPSLADFARRRLGGETVPALFAPMCAGIFAGDPEKLSLAAAFPKLHEIDQGGGIVRSLLRRKKDKNKVGPRQMVTFKRGLQELVDLLEERLGDSLRLESRVQSVEKSEDGFHVRVSTKDGELTVASPKIVFSSPAFASAKLSEDFAPKLSSLLSKLIYADLAVIALGYPEAQVAAPLSGFGALVGEDKRDKPLRSLGYLQSSDVFPDRAPPGHRLFRVMLGGVKSPELLDLSDEELYALTQGELKELMGVTGSPVYQRIYRHRRGIPQYIVGHKPWLEELEEARKEIPGLYLSGNSYHGPGLADVMRNAFKVADSVLSNLRE
ncbi:MAG: protoporphyrinogen oxidase, partial [Planctomycetota bacterium]|nr:protoporphyrinogen oxidase [Planctomycetota bacterium]